MNEIASAHSQGGIDSAIHPQQATLSSLRMPQEWKLPAWTDLKVPAGGVVWPLVPQPQQATVPSSRTPHE